MGQGRVAALDVLEDGDGLGHAVAAQKRERVVEAVGDGVGGEVRGLLQLGDGLGVGGRILVECLAEIAVTLERVFRRSGGSQDEEREDHGRQRENGSHGAIIT